jgi:hypothetical protein
MQAYLQEINRLCTDLRKLDDKVDMIETKMDRKLELIRQGIKTLLVRSRMNGYSSQGPSDQ